MAKTGFRFGEYLAALPEGLDSYPECQTKGSLFRSALAGHDVNELKGLPEVLHKHIHDPPPAGLWIPAVHVIATVHAICDRYYPSEQEVLAWGMRRTSTVAAHTFYRPLLRVSGPRVFFSMTARVNRLFQRGTSFDMEVNERGRSVARLSFPPYLHTRLSLLGTISLCNRVVELTGGTPLGTEMAELGPTFALFDCRWK